MPRRKRTPEEIARKERTKALMKELNIKDMDDIRAVADKAEVKLPKEFLPYPSYEEMLFYV